MKTISIDLLRKSLGETFGQYWMTLTYCAALALFCTLMSRDQDFGKEHLNAAMMVYLVTGVFVSFSLELRRPIYSRRWMIIAAAISHIAIILNAIYVAHVGATDVKIGWNGKTHISLTMAHLFDIDAIVALCLVSPFVHPFFEKKNDIRMWNFSRKFIINGTLNSIVIVALQIGSVLLITSAEELFDITLRSIHIYVAIWLWLLLFPTIILMRTPLLSEIQTERVRDKFSFVILRLFSVLLCVYLLMLYVYVLRIAFTWDLPKGMVSLPVSCMMILLIAVRFIAYGINTEEKKLDAKFLKLLPWLALPTLLLMSIGIGRRLMDYGMTAPRLYVVLLNLWFYAVCIYLMLESRKSKTENQKHHQRLMPIVLSFIIIVFFSSFGPTSAWRLFPKEDTEKGNVAVEVEEDKLLYRHDYYFGSTYIYNRTEAIQLPNTISKLHPFNKYYLSVDCEPDENGVYLIDCIEDYPFRISRDQLLDPSEYPMALKCTNGKTIVLYHCHIYYNDADDSLKSIRLTEITGFTAE